MEPKKIELIGAAGIMCGLGREKISIDLTEIIPDSAVSVAIKGDNGTGKSTLINLGMVPWLNVPHLEGNGYDQFTDGNGSRILEWAHGGADYKSEIHYKQTKKTAKITAALHVKENGDWRPYKTRSGLPSDGKVRTYQECIEDVLGSQSLYYISAFRAQGINIAEIMKGGDAKELMRYLLGLDSLHALSEKAVLIRREINRELRSMKDQNEMDEQRKVQYAEDLNRVSVLDSELVDASGAAKKLSTDAAIAEAEYKRIVEKGLDEAKLVQEKERFERDLAELQRKAIEIEQKASTRIAAAKRAASEIERRAGDDIETAVQQMSKSLARIDELRATMSREQEIRDSLIDVPEEVEAKEAAEAKIVKAKQALIDRRHIEREISKLRVELESVMAKGRATKDKIGVAEKQSSFISEVPCGGEGKYAECPALKDAINQREKIPSLTLVRTNLLEDYAAIKANIDTKEQEASLLHGEDENLVRLQAEIDGINKRIADDKLNREKLKSIESAGQDISREESVAGLMKERVSKLRLQLASDLAKSDADIAKERQDADAEKEMIEQQMQPIKSRIEELNLSISGDNAEKISVAKSALDNASDQVKQNDRRISDLGAEASALKVKIADFEKDQAGRAMRLKKFSELEDQQAHWSNVREAILGIMDLSIEDAGPGISAIANDLLLDAYGPRFSIEIITQEQRANGTTAECFKIHVIDAQTGVSTDIMHKSGGEKVWITKALSDAVGIFYQASTGNQIGTIFSDESEDGLTQERKLQFYKMDRAMMNRGGYHRKYSISHDPNAWNAADAVIDMEGFRV